MRTTRTLLFTSFVMHAVFAYAETADVCVPVFEKAERKQAPITESTAGRSVVGAGRLYFHTAPDQQCRLKDLFVVTGDRLEAFVEFGEFTSVIYWNPATGPGTAGWVLTSRMAVDSNSIVAAPALQ